jgi:hypothetical protein
MTTKQKYIIAYRLLRYCGDFQTFNTLCFSYEVNKAIRERAFESYMNSKL